MAAASRLAVDDAAGVHMAWCDSVHIDVKGIDLVGDASGEVTAATGSYHVADSEPWGWRIELKPQGTDGFRLRMFNILPSTVGGMEGLAVQADYTRACVVAAQAYGVREHPRLRG